MAVDPPPRALADEEALRRFDAALHRREELVGQREQKLDAMTGFLQTQSDELQVQLQDGRDANAQLLLASLRSQSLAETAEMASARKDEFLAMLSHELRNPLAPMLHVIEILGRIGAAEPRLPWIHGVLDRQVKQLARLLDDLLDAARVRTGKLVMKKQQIEAHGFIEQALEASRPLAEARRQQLIADVPDEPLFLEGDSARLTQVFANLLNNASKYTPEGGTVTVRMRRWEGLLVVSVSDDGQGLSAAALPRIFELFSQEDQSLAHAQGGLGIGLAVVRELVQLHGGHVGAYSEGAGKGSEFRVTLPLLDEAHASAAAVALALARTDAPIDLAAKPAHRLSIVLIEDNVDANQTLAALLTMVGHQVESAYDGLAGVALVLAKQPQVVLCDLGLPGLDGLQVAARLRAEVAGPQPMLVALTGYGQSADVVRSKAAGFGEHLVKPVDPPVLLALLEREAERLAGSAGAAH